VRVGRVHVTTGRGGHATASVVIRRPGAKRATVRAPGYRPSHANFRAIRRR